MADHISGDVRPHTPANLGAKMSSDTRDMYRRELTRRVDEAVDREGLSTRRRNALVGLVNVMAGACDESGVLWISFGRLAERVGKSPRTVRRLAEDLETLGVVGKDAVVWAVDLGAIVAERGVGGLGARGGRQSANRYTLNVSTPSVEIDQVAETAAGTVSSGTTPGRRADDVGTPWDDAGLPESSPTVPARSVVVPILEGTPSVGPADGDTFVPIWEMIRAAIPDMTPAVADRMARVMSRRADGVAKVEEIIRRSTKPDVRNRPGYFVNAVKREALDPSPVSASSEAARRYGAPMRSAEGVAEELDRQRVEAERRFHELTGVAA